VRRLLLISLGLLLVGCDAEPTYEGRPVSYWQKQLKVDDFMARARACTVIGVIGRPAKSTIPDLITCLNDKEYMVRLEATGALSRMGSDAEAAVPRLLELLKDPMPAVRQNASMALQSIDREAWARSLAGEEKK
jgi:HEAT repeat protein